VNYLSAENISKSYNDRWLFRGLSLGISKGEKFALVGENGAGKTTLIRILTGVITPDEGEVVVRDGVRIGALVQQPVADPAATISDLLFSEENEIARVVREYEHCLQHPDTSADRMQEILIKMEDLNAWDYESRVKEITSKLDITDLDKTFGALSGGQRKRAFLARLLLSAPDLIILDEPTNHLDLQAIEWLEQYLSGNDITLIMVTHDRYFLDQVASEILELDRGKLYRYKGNYAYFLEKKSEREEMLKTEVAKARNLMKKELEWMRRQPKARGTKAKYRIEAFHELKEKASINLKRDKLELDISESRQGGKILEVNHLHKAFNGKSTVADFNYIFKKKDRIGMVGRNGVGKSTFLNMLSGNLKPDKGEVIPGVTTKFGYFRQETEDLNPANRVIEEVKQIAEFITLSDGTQLSVSRFLEQFLFSPEKQYTYIEKLSGGEKKRLQLLKVLVRNPNFLILDEPTNDFDMDTLNVLEDFLEKFSGCLLLVSHDRYFMDRLVDQLFIFEGDGKIRVFNGNYSDYRSEEDNTEIEAAEPVKSAVPVQTEALPKSKKKISFAEKKEYENLQNEISALETERRNIEAELNSGVSDHQVLNELSARFKQLTEQIDQKTLRWLELDELMTETEK
jgi:ATP-binding cassette subfamily F protein uup